MKKLDNIHYNISRICSYNKAFNFVISEREAGKSTAIWLYIWKRFTKGFTTLVIRRRIVDITYSYIMDTFNIFANFVDNFNMDLVSFNKGDCKEGIVDVFYDKKLFIRVIGLSKPLYALKGLILQNIGLIVFDEFICNMRLGEKYLSDEAFRFKELYNTFQREYDGKLKCFFMGNPYSLYNPYFSWLQVDTTLLKPGAIVDGDDWIIECYKITDELKEHIIKKNPLYKFDDAYKKYAFDGEAINDVNIRTSKIMPNGFTLEYAFRIDNHFLGIYENNDYLNDDFRFYVDEISNISNRKKTYCFDFNELQAHTSIVTMEDRFKFSRLKRAFGNREIVFKNLECYYLLEEVYTTL